MHELEITNHKNETTRNDTKLKELTENSESRKKQDARREKQEARSKEQGTISKKKEWGRSTKFLDVFHSLIDF